MTKKRRKDELVYVEPGHNSLAWIIDRTPPAFTSPPECANCHRGVGRTQLCIRLRRRVYHLCKSCAEQFHSDLDSSFAIVGW